MEPNRDTITLKTSSIFQFAYTVPLCSMFLYFTKLMLFGPSIIQLNGVTVTEDLHITFTDNSGQPYLQGVSDFNLPEGQLPVYCRFQQNNDGMGCLESPHHQMIKVIEDESGMDGVTCYQVRREGLRCMNQMVKDCYNLGNSHWYGGFEAFHQRWPLKKYVPYTEVVILTEEESLPQVEGVELQMGPYVTGDYGLHKTELQNVLERLFISSSGVGIMVSEDTPLYLSFNQHGDRQLCMAALYDGTHFFSHHGKAPALEYTVCKANDVREIHSYMKRRFIPKPQGIPSAALFEKPIWSTWASYNKNINQTAVMDFAGQIEKYKLPCAQIEIDDEWTPNYGDLEFDPIKFPDPQKMVSDLAKKGYPVTLWTHPFVNFGSQAFKEALELGYLVKMKGSDTVATVRWWNGDLASLVDITNPAAALWYQAKLLALQQKYNITSFKFDGGEAHFVPHSHVTYLSMHSSNEYSSLWAELASNVDRESRRQEVRTAWRSQQLPVLLRIHDRMSTWGDDGGLRTVIPTVLTLGVIGYPFVLPDMIGGNAYVDAEHFEHGAFPERELYIRWLQLNTFLPAVQFSITPWMYDQEVVDIAKNMMNIRQKYLTKLLDLAQESVQTGNPIIRPLWWLDGQSEEALTTDDEFLVGNDLLVAPVIEQGARKRDIYLPEGYWKAGTGGDAVRGPTLLKDYPVALEELPFFERVDNQ